MGANMIRTAVVDDHPIFMHGLAQAVASRSGFELVRAVGSVEALTPETIAALDLVILDLGLPGMGGPDAVRYVIENGCKVLVVSAEGSRADVVAAIGAGASGYLTKSSEPDEIIAAARIVAEGGSFVSATLASYLLRSASEVADEEPGFHLTDRERDILRLLARGDRNKDIARELSVSTRTVETHIENVRLKAGARLTRVELAHLAMKEGIASSSDARPRDSGRSKRTAAVDHEPGEFG